MQLLDSKLVTRKELSFQYCVPINHDGVPVLGAFHNGHMVFQMCLETPGQLCVCIILNSDAAILRRRGGIWPIYMSCPFLPAELLNRSSLMPHIGMIPTIKFKRGRYTEMYGSSAKKMFAARKRNLVQQCIALVASLVNDNAKGRLMRVQGLYQMVNMRVMCVSCDHAENVDLNGCRSLSCPRCLGVSSKGCEVDLFARDEGFNDYADSSDPEDSSDSEDSSPPQESSKHGIDAAVRSSATGVLERPFNWTYDASRKGVPAPRTSSLSKEQVLENAEGVFGRKPEILLDADQKNVQWDKVNWNKFTQVSQVLGIYPVPNPLWHVQNLEICHSTPVDEMHGYRLGVLLRALEYSMLHLLVALEHPKDGTMVLFRLKARMLSVGKSRTGGHVFVTDQLEQWYDEAKIRAAIVNGDLSTKVPPGKPFHLGNLSAAETHQVVEDAPIILDNILHGLTLRSGWTDAVKADIALLTRLLGVYRKVTAPFFTATQLERLELEIIDTTIQMNKTIGTENTNVPKVHLMAHTVMDMRNFGSVLTYTTEPMERRHQDLKAMAEQTNRRPGWERQLLLASARRDLVHWTGTGRATESDDETDDDDQSTASPEMCTLRSSRTAGTFPLVDMMAQHHRTSSYYTLTAPEFLSRTAGPKQTTKMCISFDDTLEKSGWLLKACPVLETLGILTCQYLYHIFWKGSSGGVHARDGGRALPDSQNSAEVLSWLTSFTQNRGGWAQSADGVRVGTGVEFFTCLKISVPSLSPTSLRLRASPVMSKTFFGRTMEGSTIVWVPYPKFDGTFVLKKDFTPLRDAKHMELLRYAKVECFFRFESYVAPKKKIDKWQCKENLCGCTRHNMALIREFEVWQCPDTACSFDTIQLAACAQPQGNQMLRVIEVDRILGNILLVRNQNHPTIPHAATCGGKALPPGITTNSGVGKSDGSPLWHIHDEWKSRRTRLFAGIHSVQ